MRFQEKPPGDIPVAVVDQPAIRGDQSLPVPAIDRWQVIPGNPGLQVMQHMQVVVEEQQPEHMAVLDDRRALLVPSA